MPYDQSLANRIRQILKRRKGITERKMFGGLAFLLNGNMCCGVIGTNLVLRLGTEGAADALKEPHTREMDFTGKPMRTMVYVSEQGCAQDENLREWINRSVMFAKTLPAKS